MKSKPLRCACRLHDAAYTAFRHSSLLQQAYRPSAASHPLSLVSALVRRRELVATNASRTVPQTRSPGRRKGSAPSHPNARARKRTHARTHSIHHIPHTTHRTAQSFSERRETRRRKSLVYWIQDDGVLHTLVFFWSRSIFGKSSRIPSYCSEPIAQTNARNSAEMNPTKTHATTRYCCSHTQRVTRYNVIRSRGVQRQGDRADSLESR